MRPFVDRLDAGARLARRLEHLRGQDIVVLGLPRGGVPVASEVAKRLQAPLDLIVVGKLGLPSQPEFAMGAIGEGGFRVVNRSRRLRLPVTSRQWQEVELQERRALTERVARLRRGRARVDLRGRVAVVVDDGIATGSTAQVACDIARHLGAARVVVAVPVAPRGTKARLTGADEVVCVDTPHPFGSVGQHYDDFSATSEDEVTVLLDSAAGGFRGTGAAPDGEATSRMPGDDQPR